MQLNEVLKHDTVWSIYKFRDPDGKIAEKLKAGASIEEVLRENPHALREIDIEKGNILLNEGITEIWNLVIGSYRAVSGESIGTGDGTATTFSATLANTPVKPGSVSVTDGTETFTDNGDGTLTGSAGGSGTINYVTGEISVTFAAAPTSGASITADYSWLNVFDSTNAQIGVGDGTTAEDATQTDLVGTNTAYVGMDSGYPSVSGQTVSFRSTFDGNTGNFAWEEFTVKHSASAINLNRKVVSKGTKASGETWTVTLEITLS